MIALLCLAAPSPPPPRAIHYVIRVSELEEVLEFTDKVLGMKVLRHEENEAACEITYQRPPSGSLLVSCSRHGQPQTPCAVQTSRSL